MPSILSLLFALLMAAPALADGPAGLIGTPDERAALISKDVGGARWAIYVSLEPDNPFTTTGNVFSPNGNAAFVWCTPTALSGDQSQLATVVFHFDCYGNDACHVPGNCPEWNLIASDVQLPGTFYIPK